MSQVTWDPDDRKPRDAVALEAAMQRLAPGVQVKLTLLDGQWLVRALGPAAMCSRGPEAAGRDLSDQIAELLIEHEYPAYAGLRKTRG